MIDSETHQWYSAAVLVPRSWAPNDRGIARALHPSVAVALSNVATVTIAV